jgi:hypothetical protein
VTSAATGERIARCWYTNWPHISTGRPASSGRRGASIALSADVPADFVRVQRGEKALAAWAFYVRHKNGWTRLLARGSGGAAGRASFDIPHSIVEPKMCAVFAIAPREHAENHLSATPNRCWQPH